MWLKNFAGKINSNPAKAILHTLQKSFGQCRVLHDLPPAQPDLLNTFVNLVGFNLLTWRAVTQSSVMQVFFCSPSTKRLSFRSPTETDYAGSHLRAMIFGTLLEREVDMKLIRGDTASGDNWVLSDDSNRLMDWQKSEALEHWRCTWLLLSSLQGFYSTSRSVMRSIFPEPLWATY